jgi:hypothetical protein
MKHLVRLTVALSCLALGVPAVYAYCFYPQQVTVDYYQHHQSCGEPGPHGLRPCIDWWSLDGQCTTNCNGSTFCSGDTQVRSNTLFDYHYEDVCEPICE